MLQCSNGLGALLLDPAGAAGLWPILRGEMPSRRLVEALGKR